MSDKTLEFIDKKIAMWLEAEDKVVLGQSYTIGNRQLTSTDLSKIHNYVLFGNVDLTDNVWWKTLQTRVWCH